MIRTEFKADALLAALQGIQGGLTDKSVLMNQLGEALVQSNQERTEQGVSVDGTPFAPRRQSTMDAYATAKPPKSPVGGPLMLSGIMKEQINHSYGPDSTEVGSNAIQAAMMHFGGSKAQFPNLWGDIIARPFIGISDSDEIELIEIVEDWGEGMIG